MQLMGDESITTTSRHCPTDSSDWPGQEAHKPASGSSQGVSLRSVVCEKGIVKSHHPDAAKSRISRNIARRILNIMKVPDLSLNSINRTKSPVQRQRR